MKSETAFSLVLALILAVTLLTAAAFAVEYHHSEEALNNMLFEKQFSPYAGCTYPTRVLWGDQHLHTAISVDAGTMCRLGQGDAYIDSGNRLFYPQ